MENLESCQIVASLIKYHPVCDGEIFYFTNFGGYGQQKKIIEMDVSS